MFREWNIFQWSIAGSVTLALSFTSIWLFIHIKFENRDKKWFKLIFNGKEWTPLMKSMQLLDQLNDYMSDNKPETNPSA
jgi:F0F1-type ATP synthase membrane subunit a